MKLLPFLRTTQSSIFLREDVSNLPQTQWEDKTVDYKNINSNQVWVQRVFVRIQRSLLHHCPAGRMKTVVKWIEFFITRNTALLMWV